MLIASTVKWVRCPNEQQKLNGSKKISIWIIIPLNWSFHLFSSNNKFFSVTRSFQKTFYRRIYIQYFAPVLLRLLWLVCEILYQVWLLRERNLRSRWYLWQKVWILDNLVLTSLVTIENTFHGVAIHCLQRVLPWSVWRLTESLTELLTIQKQSSKPLGWIALKSKDSSFILVKLYRKCFTFFGIYTT